MAINKTFGYVAHIHGIQQYAEVMLVCLALLGGASLACRSDNSAESHRIATS